jgi:hypothetical protein
LVVFIVFRLMSFVLMMRRKKRRKKRRKSRLMKILSYGFRLRSTNPRSWSSCCHPNRMSRCFWFLRSMMIRCCFVRALSTAPKMMMILRVRCKPAYCFRCCVTGWCCCCKPSHCSACLYRWYCAWCCKKVWN